MYSKLDVSMAIIWTIGVRAPSDLGGEAGDLLARKLHAMPESERVESTQIIA